MAQQKRSKMGREESRERAIGLAEGVRDEVETEGIGWAWIGYALVCVWAADRFSALTRWVGL